MALAQPATEAFVSSASLWEIAIKSRLGKLDAGIDLQHLPAFLESCGVGILDINRYHAVTYVEPEATTNDPFDRMLLVQCQLESLRLVTVDRALVDHPLAWRPGVA